MIKNKLLFTVGPLEMDQEILEIGSNKIPYFRTDEFSKINIECANLLKKFCYTSNDSECVILTGSGTAAMEAAVINCFDSNDKVLIISGGSFGDRFKEICDLHELNYDVLRADIGSDITKNKLNEYKDKGYTGMLINAHETSTGVLYDMKMIGEFCKEQNILLVCDAISTFLADEYYMDKWNIDVTIISSQKSLALPPGLSFILINKRTIERILKNNVKSLYFNLPNYIKNMERGQTPFTPAVSIILQLHYRLNCIEKIGVENLIKNAEKLANDFRSKLEKNKIPLKIASKSLSNTLTPLNPMGKMTAHEIYKYLYEKYNISVCPNGGKHKDSLFRVGHIGNLNTTDNDKLINALLTMKEKNIL